MKQTLTNSNLAKVRVYGKAQNRTALGIVHAYMAMHPQTTLEELRKAFPNTLNPDKGVSENFVYVEDKGTTANFEGYFRGDDEVVTVTNGRKVSVVTMWTKASFERMVEAAKAYDIEVAAFEPAGKAGQKGGFRLEYINGYVPPVPVGRSRQWIWWLLAAILLLAILFLLLRRPNVVEVEKVVKVIDTVKVERVVTIVDTVYIHEVEAIEKNFNAAKFTAGKADLSDDAKFVLHDLAKVMEKNRALKLRIVGHSSVEGNESFNQQLSEARAKAAVDFLISRGIDADRLQYEGKGASEPIDTENLDANRRTEFIIID